MVLVDNAKLFADTTDAPIKLLKDDTEVTQLQNIVTDNTGKAIVKIKLCPKSDEDYKKLKEKFKDNKVTKLYIGINYYR